MDMGPHAGFIWATYAVTAVVIAGLVFRAIFEERKQRQAQTRLEAQGIRRRSEAHSENGTSA